MYEELKFSWPAASDAQRIYHRLLFDCCNEALVLAAEKACLILVCVL